MSYIIDRFEGDFALCEDAESGGKATLPRAEIPPDAREGDVLVPAGDGMYAIDAAATAKRRARIRARFDRMRGTK